MDAAIDIPTSQQPTSNVWLDVLKFYGLGTLLAVGFFVWLTRSVSADLRTITEKADQVSAGLSQHTTDMRVEQTAQKAVQEQQLRVLTVLCRNAAETPRERDLCGVIK